MRRKQIILGTAIGCAGLIWIAGALTPEHAYLTTVLGPLILFGGGIGMTFGAMPMTAVQGVPAHQVGLASGLLNTSRQIGGAIGLAIMAAAASSLTSHLSNSESLPSAFTEGYKLAFLIAGLGLAAGTLLAFALPTAARQARDEPQAERMRHRQDESVIPRTGPAGRRH